MTPAKIALNTALIALGIGFASLGYHEFNRQHQLASISIYPEDKILLTYTEIDSFTDFLRAHKDREIHINAALHFDAATELNMEVHESCGYETILDTLTETPSQLDGFALPLPHIDRSNIVVDCADRLTFKFFEQKNLAFTYGGTGILSIRIAGNFFVETTTKNSATHYQLQQSKPH